MEHASFEEGLRALASHQTGEEAFFGHLTVGLTSESGDPLPYVQLERHRVTLNAEEAAKLEQVIIDFERFDHHGGKHAMRIEFTKEGDEWLIKHYSPVRSSLVSGPRYAAPRLIVSEQASDQSMAGKESSFELGLWRVSDLEILKDNNSIGTLVSRERAYCGKEGMQNIPFLHESAFKR